MNLSTSQIKEFHSKGFLIVKNVFSPEEINLTLRETTQVVNQDSDRRILEKNGTIRSLFSPERDSSFFNLMIKSTRLIEPAKTLLADNVYVHQTKINCKTAMMGDWWEWHQDYVYWQKEDGMPTPNVLSCMVFLNEVNEFNGPLLLIPGSHKAGTIDDDSPNTSANENDAWFAEYKKSKSYMTALVSDLKYTLKQATIARWAVENNIVSVQGEAGTVLFFHGNIFHASSNNLSPWDRYAFFITYNACTNRLTDVPNARPSFLANRDFTPVDPVDVTLSENILST